MGHFDNFLNTSNGKHNFFNFFREVPWLSNIFDQKTLKHYHNKRKCISTPVQIGPNWANSECALRDHKVLPDVTKQQLLLREFFSHQILTKKFTCLTKSFLTFSCNSVCLSKILRLFRQRVFRQGVFRQGTPSAQNSVPPFLPPSHRLYSDGGIP